MTIDLIVIVLIAIFLALGVIQGFVVSVLYLLAWIVGIISVWLFAGAFGNMLSANIEGLAPLLALCLGAFLAFLLPFLLIRIAALVAKYFIKSSSPLTTLNRVLGGIFGVFKGLAVAAIILTVTHYLPVKGTLESARNNSTSYSIYKKVPFANMWKEFKVVSDDIREQK